MCTYLVSFVHECGFWSCVNVSWRTIISSHPFSCRCECVGILRTCLCCSVHFFSIVKAKIGAYIEDYIVGVCVTCRSGRNHHNGFTIIYCRDLLTSHQTLQEIKLPLFRIIVKVLRWGYLVRMVYGVIPADIRVKTNNCQFITLRFIILRFFSFCLELQL